MNGATKTWPLNTARGCLAAWPSCAARCRHVWKRTEAAIACEPAALKGRVWRMLVRGIQWVEERGFASNHPMPYHHHHHHIHIHHLPSTYYILIPLTSTSLPPPPIYNHPHATHAHIHIPPPVHPHPTNIQITHLLLPHPTHIRITHLAITSSSHSHPHLPHCPSIYILIPSTLTSTIPIYLRHPHPIIHVHILLPDLLIFISLRPSGSINPPLSCPQQLPALAQPGLARSLSLSSSSCCCCCAAAVVKGQQMQARLFRVAAAVGNLWLSFSLQLFNLFWPLSRIWWSSPA